MITLNQLEPKIESLTEKINHLNYKFKDEELKKEADESKSEIIALLENYLDLATRDAETENEADTTDSEE